MRSASVRRFRAMTPGVVVLTLWVLPWAVNAQNAAPPTPAASAPAGKRDIPPPDQLEPGVNTSAAPAGGTTPASEAPEPAAPRAAGAAPGVAPASSAAQAAPGVSAAASASPAGQGSAARASAAPRGSEASQASAASRQAAPGTKAAARKGPDRIELDPTDITGNRELPKVLYIVPWKRADLGDLMGKPVNSLLDEVLQPVDRDVFQRENRYYDGLKPDQAGAKAGAASGSEHKP